MSGTRMATPVLPLLRGHRTCVPNEQSHNAWECRTCLRVFALSVVGVAV